MKKNLIILTLILLLLMGCNNKSNVKPNSESSPNLENNKPDKNIPIEDIEKNDSDSNDDSTLFREFNDDANKVLVKMTIEEKIGQMFLVRCPLEESLNSFMSMQPGGFIMFGRDFSEKTKDEVIKNINSYQALSKIPMIIGVDEEGGTVVRVSSNPLIAGEIFKSPQKLYEIGGFKEIHDDTVLKSKLLLELGINLNLAPVADVSENKNDFIYSRSFGRSAEETAEYVNTTVNAMHEAGISGTLKHFPGYGNNIDTHTGSAYDNRPYKSFIKSDFIPFIAGIKSGAESILVSHNVVESIDKNLPASLSKKVHDILRNNLNFTGIIMTDDMSMGAIQQSEAIHSPEIMAIEAGNDMLIVTDFETSYNSLLNAVKSNKISIEKIDESVLRILKWKYYMGIM